MATGVKCIPQLLNIAYHEAGHAAAAIKAGMTFESISIEPIPFNKNQTAIGHLKLNRNSMLGFPMDKAMGVLLGGFVAQLIFLGSAADVKEVVGSALDVRTSYQLVQYITKWSKEKVEKQVDDIQAKRELTGRLWM